MNAKEFGAQLRAMPHIVWVKDFVHGRRVAFKHVFRVPAVDWSTAAGAAWAGQLRLLPEAAGTALASFGFTAVVDGDDTIVTMTLTKPHDIAGMPSPPAGQNLVPLFYDVHLTPPGGDKQIFMGGGFDIIGGVQT